MLKPTPIALTNDSGWNAALANQNKEEMRRAFLARTSGVGMLVAAVILLFLFIDKPMGTLPGNPQSWRGGPLILGSAFLGIFGAFLVVLRRFSLAGFMVAGLTSGIAATCAHAYAYSIMDTAVKGATFYLPEKKTHDFVEQSRAALTPQRLSSFAVALYNEGYLPRGVDFDTVNVSYGGLPTNKEVVNVNLNYSYSSFVHPYETGARLAVAQYANLVNAWIASRLKDEKWDSVGTANHLITPYGYAASPSTARIEVWQLCQEMISDKNYDYRTWKTLDSFKAYCDALKWLCDRESDAELKRFLEDTLKEYEKLGSNVPVVH